MVTKWFFDDADRTKEYGGCTYPNLHEYITLADHQAALAEKDRAINFHKSAAEVANLRRDDMSRVLSLKEKEVAEKDKEIEALKEWRANVTCSLLRPDGAFFEDVPKHVKDLAIGYNTLMARAIKFAEQVRDSGINGDKRAEASCFLSRPDVVAWKKGQEA